jgi:hypothetical protein
MRSSTPNLVKLVKLSWYGYQLKKYRHENAIQCGWSSISSYLEKGISKADEAYLISVIDEYISQVFNNSNTQQLILVTHPHRAHLENNYSLNIGNLMRKSIESSKFKSQIKLIDFNKNFSRSPNEEQLKYMFVEGDLASHLNAHYYTNVFLRTILMEVDTSL